VTAPGVARGCATMPGAMDADPPTPSTPRSLVWRAALAVLLAAVAMVSGWALPASAHAELLSTTPSAGQQLTASPGVIVLHFGESVEVQFGSIQVFDRKARRVDSGRARHAGGDPRSVEIAVPANLGDGGYVVTWRVISADSHPVHGAFTFLIGRADAGATRSEAARLLAAGGGSALVGYLFGAIRAIAFLGLAVLVGSTAFVAAAWPAGRRDRRATRLLWAGWTASVAATVLAIAIQGPYGSGQSLAGMVKPSEIGDVLRTRFGEVYGMRVLLLVAIALPLLRSFLRDDPEHAPTRGWSLAAAATGLALLVTPGLAGHAATGEFVALAVPFDLIHVTGAAVWVGGLAVLAAAALHDANTAAEDSVLEDVVPRYSQWAFASVVAIAVSGAFAAWRQVGLTVDAYTTTTFGRLVLAKTAVFLVLLGIASTSRRMVHGRLALPGRPARSAAEAAAEPGPGPGPVQTPDDGSARAGRGRALRRAVAFELALALAVFGLTAGLVNSIPARAALALPFSTEVKAGPKLLLDVDVEPAKAGIVSIHGYTLTVDGQQEEVEGVSATIELKSAGIAPIAVPLLKAGPAHFAAYAVDIPIPGTWTLQVNLQTDRFTVVPADPIDIHFR